MRDRSRNASVLNHRVIKYVNDIIRKVYRPKSNHIDHFGTDFSAGTAKAQRRSLAIEQAWAKTSIHNNAVINGIRLGMTKILETFIRSRRQTKVKVVKKIFLKRERIFGPINGTNKYDPVVQDNSGTTVIEAPKGYNGNFTFVKVLVPDELKESIDSGSTTLNTYNGLLGFSGKMSKDAVLFYSNKVVDGWFSIKVAKTKQSVIITTDISGLDSNTFHTTARPFFYAVVEFYKRGV